LEEVAEICYVGHAAQKTRKAVEAKTREKAEKKRLVEEKKKKNKSSTFSNSRTRY